MRSSKELVINFNPVMDENELTLFDKIKLAISSAQSDYSNFHSHDYPQTLNRGHEPGLFCFMLHRKGGIKQASEFDRSINHAVSLEAVIDLIDTFLNAETTSHHAHSFSSYVMDALIALFKKISSEVNVFPDAKSGCYSSSARESVLVQLKNQANAYVQVFGLLKADYKIKIKLSENLFPVDNSFSTKNLMMELNRCPKKYFENVHDQAGTLLAVGDIWPGIFCLLDLDALFCMILSCKKAALLANDDKTRERLFMLKARKLAELPYTKKSVMGFLGIPSTAVEKITTSYYSISGPNYRPFI